MSFFQESLKRLLTASTLRGVVRPAQTSDAPVTEFTCHVQQVKTESRLHERSFIVELKVNGHNEQVAFPVSVHGVDSARIISLQDLNLPNVGTIQQAEVLFHNGLFAGMWVCNDIRGHVYGRVESQRRSERPECYVIERSGEVLREWWTGEGWSDDSRQAHWYEHEPNAPRDTGDEGAHQMFYPTGKIEAG